MPIESTRALAPEECFSSILFEIQIFPQPVYSHMDIHCLSSERQLAIDAPAPSAPAMIAASGG
jgi:hypothetical protein